MKTSSADVRSREAKRYFFLLRVPVTLLAAALASWMEIEPLFDAGVMTKRPVAALRPSTALPCLPGLLPTVSERVAMIINVRASSATRKRRFRTRDGVLSKTADAGSHYPCRRQLLPCVCPLAPGADPQMALFPG